MQPKAPFWGNTIILILLLVRLNGQAQTQVSDSSHKVKQRKTFVLAGNAVAYSASMYGLYNLWYKDYPLTSFHFHNDNRDWYQMDKVGHAYSCYYEGVVGIDMLKWADFSHQTASILGGSYGFFIQTGIEIFDGFSEQWGASTGDIVANTIGSGMVISQSLIVGRTKGLDEAIVSTHPIREHSARDYWVQSDVERLFKDYNGQTYWLSGNVKSFLKRMTTLSQNGST